jgi:two-component system response regulator ArlR
VKILVIEDEKNLSRFIELELVSINHDVTVCRDGLEGYNKALEEEFDIIILDWMLPGMSGIDILQNLKGQKDVPVIMITAKDLVDDEVKALNMGADDFLKKPFDNDQLIARINSVLRRSNKSSEVMSTLKHRNVEIDLTLLEVKVDGELVHLSKTELDLLIYLIKNKNKVISRDEILDSVWGYESFNNSNVVDVYIRYLRNKIGDAFISTVRGYGYIVRDSE